jgi:hypothetical protein
MPEAKATIRCLDGRFELILSQLRNDTVHLDETAGYMPAILISSWCTILSDSPVDRLKPKELYSQILREAVSIGLMQVIDKYSRLYDALTASIFLRDGVLTHAFLPAFKDTPIFREYLHWFRTGSTSTFRFISTFLRFGKKCEFSLDEFRTRAFRSWCEVEERILTIKRDADLTRDLRHVLTSLLPRVPVGEIPFRGRHGSGAVSGSERGTIAKCHALTTNARIRLLNSVASPFRTFSYLMDAAEGGAVDQPSRLMFVPKNYKTARSICMEPTEMMYMQQHVRQYLEEAIRASSLRHFVQIDNQERNQLGALYGSRSNLVDTLDLSAASDSVSAQLVRDIFPRDWLIGLLATRTSKVITPDGSVRVVSKFAPMGSALCFPVQSILYSCIVILAYLRHAYGATPILSLTHAQIVRFVENEIGREWRTSHSFESIAVYGDDIICDTRVTEDVIFLLEEMGLVVNNDKSFLGPQAFRESCGMYALAGENVTPFQFKAKEVGKEFDARSLASIVELTNMSGDMGYRNLHSFLIGFLLRWGAVRDVNPIVFTEWRKTVGDSQGIKLNTSVYSRNPHNSHLKKRVCAPLQREEYKAWRITYRTRYRQLDVAGDKYDRYLYDLFQQRGESDVIDALPGTSDELRGAVLRRSWIPTY